LKAALTVSYVPGTTFTVTACSSVGELETGAQSLAGLTPGKIAVGREWAFRCEHVAGLLGPVERLKPESE
jgi:hypothetical protein